MTITPALNKVQSRIIKGTIINAPYLTIRLDDIAFSAKFSPSHLFTFTTTACLQEQGPLYDYHLKRWESRKEPLWTSFVSNKDVSNKKVVKTVFEKKLRGAFLKSMEKYGYAKDGTKLRGEVSTINKNNGDLVGTVQFMAHSQALTTKSEDLQKQMDAAVQQMIDRQTSSEGVKISKSISKKQSRQRKTK